MAKNKKKKSFSMIEIIIVSSILSFLFLVNIANYNQYNEEIKIKNEAKKFIDVFELTKKDAYSSFLYDKNCLDFKGYQISINSTGKEYVVYFLCSTTSTEIKKYQLKENIFFINGANSNFRFYPLTGVNIETTNLRIKNSNINKCLDISITNNGIINYAESLFSC